LLRRSNYLQTEQKGEFFDDDDADLTPRTAYPPTPQLSPQDTRTWWQKVGGSLRARTHSSCSHPSSQILPDSIACRLYVITVLVETTVDLVIEGDLLLRFHEAEKSSSQTGGDLSVTSQKMPVFLSVFALAQYVPPMQPFLLLFVNSMSPASFSWVWHWTPCTLETPCNFSRSREFGPLLRNCALR
jgi:hypothetical protein